MNKVYDKNGFIYIHIEDTDYEYPEWVTTDYSTGDPYFLLNETTSKLFVKDYRKMILDKKLDINPYLYSDIANFDQNLPREHDYELIKTHKSITLQDHQVTAIEKMLSHRRFALFYGTGTGKTMIALFYILITRPKRVLIVTPKKVVPQYKQEIEDKLGDYYALAEDTVETNTIMVVNPEALHKIKYSWIDCMIVDESHKAKNPMSIINENLCKIAKSCDNIYLFTGTPQDKQFSEIFPQLAILDRRCYPSKTRWNYRYYRLDDYHNPRILKKHLKKELTSMIEAYSHAVKTEDVLDLPPMVYKTIEVEHPGEVYTKLLQDRVVKIMNGTTLYTVVADMPATCRIKLQEICSGFLLDVPGKEDYVTFKGSPYLVDITSEVVRLKCRKNKQNALEKLLTEEQGQAIIFTCFNEEIKLVEEVLKKMYRKYNIINGYTSMSEVKRIKNRFKDEDINYLIANVKCTSEGLDLYFINNVIFYSLPDSYITYHQCCARIHRIGQDKDSNIWHLLCKDTIEESKLKALRKKESYSNALFHNFVFGKEEK